MVITIMISTISVSFAKEDVLTGKINSFTYEFNRTTGVLTCSGLGMAGGGFITEALGISDLSEVNELIIKEGVYLFDVFPGNFKTLTGLTSVTIPSTMKRMACNLFLNAEKLETVNYGGNKEDWASVIFDEGNDILSEVDINYNVEVPMSDGAENYKWDMIDKIGSIYTMNYYTGVLTVSYSKDFEGSDIFGPSEPWQDPLPITHILSGVDGMDDIYSGGHFYEPALQHIILESGITEIGSEILAGEWLESITIPKTVTKIDEHSLYTYCENDDFIIYYEGSKADWKNIDIGINNAPIILAEKHFESKAGAKELIYKLSQKNFVFNSDNQYPQVIVTDANGRDLEKNMDYYTEVDSDLWEMGQTGKYKLTIKLCGEYTGEESKYFYIRAKAPKITNTVSRSKGFTVYWNKRNWMENGKADRYEVQYSTSQKFTNAKTITMNHPDNYAKRVTGLRTGTTYYVRVRALTKVSDGYIRSAWSDTVNVKAG